MRAVCMVLALLSMVAMAAENPNSGSRRFGSKVIKPGDSVQRLVEAAGEPRQRGLRLALARQQAR